MKTTVLAIALTVILHLALGCFAPVNAAEKSSCRGCTRTYISVPRYARMPELFSLFTPDGPLVYQVVNQIGPIVPITRIRRWCMCMDADRETGPNPEPEPRWCQYSEIVDQGMGGDTSYFEAPYCHWDGMASETSCKPVPLLQCPPG
jgi:hypothetical protein